MLEMNKLLGSRRGAAFCLVGLALCAGCGPTFGEVAGTVTFKAKIVASGTVIIVGSDSLPHYGNIGDDGAYTVGNVPTGLAKLAVLSPGPKPGKQLQSFPTTTKPGFENMLAPAPFRGDPKKWFPLPEKYREFATSGLTWTVTDGVNQFDISLD